MRCKELGLMPCAIQGIMDPNTFAKHLETFLCGPKVKQVCPGCLVCDADHLRVAESPSALSGAAQVSRGPAMAKKGQNPGCRSGPFRS